MSSSAKLSLTESGSMCMRFCLRDSCPCVKELGNEEAGKGITGTEHIILSKSEGKNMKDLSIIIPVYNCDKYIERCLSNIYRQNLKNFEVIIIDDSSTDNSLKIVQQFCSTHSECSIIRNPYNKGAGPSRNVGLKVATGKYIIFLDADDYWKMYTISEFINQIDDFDLLVGGFWITENNVILDKKNEDEKILDCAEYITNMLIPSTQYLYSVLWNKLFLRRIIIENKISFESNITVCEDWPFMLKYLASCRKIKIIPYAFYYYEQGNPLSLVKKVRKKGENWRSLFEVYKFIKTYCFRYNIFYSNLNYIANFMLNPLIKELIEIRIYQNISTLEVFFSDVDIQQIILNARATDRYEKLLLYLIRHKKYNLLYRILSYNWLRTEPYKVISKYNKVLSLK